MYAMKKEYLTNDHFFVAAEVQAGIRWFEVLSDDLFVRVARDRYRPTTSISCACYLIPDYMMEDLDAVVNLDTPDCDVPLSSTWDDC